MLRRTLEVIPIVIVLVSLVAGIWFPKAGYIGVGAIAVGGGLLLGLTLFGPFEAAEGGN